MYICTYIYVYVYIYMYMYICIYVYMYICIYVYMYICIYVYVYMCICVYVYMCICVYVYMLTPSKIILLWSMDDFTRAITDFELTSGYQVTRRKHDFLVNSSNGGYFEAGEVIALVDFPAIWTGILITVWWIPVLNGAEVCKADRVSFLKPGLSQLGMGQYL